MQYIVGTRFIVSTPKPRSMRECHRLQKERILPDMGYIITNIKKTGNGMQYTFTGNDNTMHTIHFESCEDADAFISKSFNNNSLTDQ